MVNHPNRRNRVVKFTVVERRALKIAIGFIMAGEWDETLSQKEADALETARDKIDQDAHNAITNLPEHPSWEEDERNCRECGVVIGNNESGLCLVHQDIRDAATKIIGQTP